MDTLNWKCIFKYNRQIYFARYSLSRIYISDGVNVVTEYAKENVTGCTYNGKVIWLSTMDSNELICIDSQEKRKLYAYSILRFCSNYKYGNRSR